MSNALDTVTQAVFDDEMCFFLAEENRLSEDSRVMCRYQLLKVVRNDHLVTAYVCLGPAANFNADQFSILGGTVDHQTRRGQAVHTVREMQEMATEFRSRPVRRELEPWDIQATFREYTDQKERFKNRVSSFGHGGQLVRSA